MVNGYSYWKGFLVLKAGIYFELFSGQYLLNISMKLS